MNREPIEIIKKDGFEIQIYYDEYCSNPREEFDNLGTMVCFHRRYRLGDPHDFSNPDELITAVNSGKYYYLPLYLLDHGMITISTKPFHDPWDSGQIGYILVEKKKAKKEAPSNVNIEDWVLNILENEIKEYDYYLTGQVYGYILYNPIGEEIDSCWGYYGELNEIIKQIEEDTQHIIENEKQIIEQKKEQIKNKIMSLSPKLLKKALNFLKEIDESNEIENFKLKIKQGYLRTALKSHLKYLTDYKNDKTIEAIIDNYILQSTI